MGLTPTELSNSKPVGIVGQDEQYAADVVSKDKQRLCVDARSSVVPGSGGSFPVLDKKYRVETSTTEIPVSGSSTNLYSYNGEGYLFGFHFDTDSDKLTFDLLVDGETIFSGVEVGFVEDLHFKKDYVNYQNGSVLGAYSGGEFDFSPPHPIYFETSILLRAYTSDGSNKKIKRSFISIVKL